MPRPLLIRIDPRKPVREQVEPAARIVAQGGLVVYPTDTVYGLGTNPLDEEAVRRLFQAKRRPPGKPVPILVSSLRAAERIAVLSDVARRLAERFWPGPLTIVVPARPGLPCVVTGCTGRVGVRMPAHDVALELIEASGGVLVGTSANISGRPSPRTAEEAIRELGDRVDVVIDAGPTPGGVPSTVVQVEEDGSIRLIRRGPISLEQMVRELGV